MVQGWSLFFDMCGGEHQPVSSFFEMCVCISVKGGATVLQHICLMCGCLMCHNTTHRVQVPPFRMVLEAKVLPENGLLEPGHPQDGPGPLGIYYH